MILPMFATRRAHDIARSAVRILSLPIAAILLAGATPVEAAIATDITAGHLHTCALTTAGGVKCWGRNEGRLGDGTTDSRVTPVDVSGLTSGVVAVSAGYHQTCALTTGGGVKCWGINDYGDVGEGTMTPRLTPVDVIGLTSGIVAIATGGGHTCAVTTGGGMKCWGYGGDGQLGNGIPSVSPTPVDVSGLASGSWQSRRATSIPARSRRWAA